MCGIVGFVGQGKSPEELQRSVDALRHRGPDSQGAQYFPEPDVFLGHTRLAILDLSDAGHQPMSLPGGNVCLSYNGEIYNFPELRRELESLGRRFVSDTDTEVILQLYDELGPRFVERLNGMFAFAIFDQKRRQLFLARDHMGVKPLYYTTHGGRFGFASEIKALLASDAAPRDVDWQAIYDYFTFLFVPMPRTAFEAIRQVPPAHTLTYDIDSRNVRVERYWRADKPNSEPISSEDAPDQMRALLEDAVQKQLVSDVPIGVFLSGGIDSATLTALAARVSSEPLKTFTVVFEGEGIAEYDESEAAAAISKHIGTDHTEVTVRVDDPEEVFDLISCFDQPFGNPTFFLSYLVSKATKPFVTVVLSGAGGDELFGGYPRYRVMRAAPWLSRIPRALGSAVSHLASAVPETEGSALVRRMKLLTRGLGRPLPEQLLRWTYYFSDDEKRALLQPDMINGWQPSRRILEGLLDRGSGRDILSRVQIADYETFLLDNVLEYTDKTSMAVGLESRVPFLDPRLVELSLRIPACQKIRGKKTKAILRDAYPDLLPRSILDAPKQGFCPPTKLWMREHFDHYFDDRLTPRAVRDQGVFEYDEIQRLRREHKAGRRDNSMELFGVLVFDHWFRTYISGS